MRNNSESEISTSKKLPESISRLQPRAALTIKTSKHQISKKQSKTFKLIISSKPSKQEESDQQTTCLTKRADSLSKYQISKNQSKTQNIKINYIKKNQMVLTRLFK